MASPQTTLSGAINGAVTALTVADVLGFPAAYAFTVEIGTERLRVTAGYGTTSWTVTRGYDGTTAAAHAGGAAVTLLQRAYTSPGAAKLRMNKTATTDDAMLLELADGINRDLNRRIGYFVGPADDTTRVYSGRAARIHCDGRRLYIPGGIRTLTGVRIATSSDGDLASVSALSDFHLGPEEWDGGSPDEPYQYVEITDNPDGDFGRFPDALRNVELTGTFGWDEVPADLAELATRQLVRAFLARSSGQTDVVGSDQAGNAIISRLWSQPDLLMVQNYRNKARA